MDTESRRNGSDGNVAELLNNSSGGYASTNGQASKYSACGCGHNEATSKSLHHTDLYRTGDEQARSAETVVVNSNGGGKLPVLDRELLNTGIGRGKPCQQRSGASNGGSGCSESKTNETNQTRFARSPVPNVLDVAVQTYSERQRTKAYNPDPRVADYESPMEVLEIWLNS